LDEVFRMTACRLGTSRVLIVGLSACSCLFPNWHVLAIEPSGAADQFNEPPVAVSPLVLEAINDSKNGKAAFSYHGNQTPPVIRASPGQTVRITYKNAMSSHSQEICVDGPCTNMTNLHFHGLHVSPNSPQDDVISMMAMPGQSLQYAVEIPLFQAPGLYWYHTHPHGESYQQSLDGMSGAIVIEGIEQYAPEVQGLRERILVLRDAVIAKNDPTSSRIMQRLEIRAAQCQASPAEPPERAFTVNGAVRPEIAIASGERQFWRIVNASPDLYADLQVDTGQLEIAALDGMPLAFHDSKNHTRRVDHILLPPAGRVEAIVTGPKSGTHASLRTHCFDTGPDGDANPDMVIADLVDRAETMPRRVQAPQHRRRPFYKPLPNQAIAELEHTAAEFVVAFTEDKNGFYINGRKYGPTDAPMTSVQVGTYRHWQVVNNTQEVHPFHIHQVHFLAYAQNGNPRDSEWLDTVNVPAGESVDLIMDFTDPIIRGISLFHCHLLKHEDKGMMAKILFK
jgi:suppressor of ftsI